MPKKTHSFAAICLGSLLFLAILFTLLLPALGYSQTPPAAYEPPPIVIIVNVKPGEPVEVKPGTLPAIRSLTPAQVDALIKSLSQQRKGGQ